MCLIAVSICQFWVDGESGILLGGGKSIILAGFDKSLFLAGEYWRILTGATLHGGLVHLAFNCYALYVLGKLIETLVKSRTSGDSIFAFDNRRRHFEFDFSS